MNCTGQGFIADGVRRQRRSRARSRPANDHGRMIAVAMVAPAPLYVDVRRVRCGLYPHEHERGMNQLGKRARPTFTGRGR
jgi:hypothetical protein